MTDSISSRERSFETYSAEMLKLDEERLRPVSSVSPVPNPKPSEKPQISAGGSTIAADSSIGAA